MGGSILTHDLHLEMLWCQWPDHCSLGWAKSRGNSVLVLKITQISHFHLDSFSKLTILASSPCLHWGINCPNLHESATYDNKNEIRKRDQKVAIAALVEPKLPQCLVNSPVSHLRVFQPPASRQMPYLRGGWLIKFYGSPVENDFGDWPSVLS